MKNQCLKLFVVLMCFALLFVSASAFAGGKQEIEGSTTEKEKAEEKKAAEKEMMKVALLMDGPITDSGWNRYPYEGLLRAGEDFDISTSYTDMIPPNEIPIVMRDYANKGYDIIIGNGYTFLDAFASVAPDYPDTMFIGISIPNAGPNWMSARVEYGELGNLVAIAMAAKTKSKKVAWTSAFEAPHDNAERDAVRAKLKEIDPEIKLLTAYSGDWYDVTKAKQAVLAVVDQGADVVLNTLSSEDALAEAARERGDFYIIGWPGESMEAGPDVILTSFIQDSSVVVYEAIKECLEGNYEPGKAFHFGLAEGANRMGKINEDLLSQETIKNLKETRDGIINGTVEVDTEVKGWD